MKAEIIKKKIEFFKASFRALVNYAELVRLHKEASSKIGTTEEQEYLEIL